MNFRILLLGIFTLFSTFLGAQEQDYLWPTSASPYLSSTFGETRAAHFHAGLDIKTWGREGYRVFATKDGIVYRLGITARGYGRVIYLQHNDGTFSVYAHLQRFYDELQSYIDSLRMITHEFEIDVRVDSLQIEVKQGEVIGYTGSTGIGPPHLHFEIRNENNEPINPLLTNLSVPDNIPPRITSLMVLPLSNTTQIEGSFYPRVYYPTEETFGPIQASGPIGLAVNVHDGANEVTNRYAVYELGLVQESDTLFFQQISEFNFDETETMFLDRLPSMNSHRRTYQRLYKVDGPGVPFYEIVKPESKIIPSDSLFNYSIFANDYYGNSTEVEIGVIESKEETTNSLARPPYEWYWTEDWVTGTPIGALNLKDEMIGIPWDSSAEQTLVALGSGTLFFDRIRPNDLSVINTPNRDLKVRFKPNTFFDTLSVGLVTGRLDTTHYFAIHPAIHIPRKSFHIEYFLSENFDPESNYQLFRIDRSRNEIMHMDSYMVGKTLHGWPDEIGEFLILPDNDPPEIEVPIISQTDYGIWIVEIAAVDSLSGIDFKNSSISVNGELGITEYDFEEHKLIYFRPGFAPTKENSIHVVVEDKAGNRIERSYQM